MKTLCRICEKVLTDERGVRQYPAIFDSVLACLYPVKQTDTHIHAFCEACYERVSMWRRAVRYGKI